MTTMDPLRCVGIRQAVLSGDGSTVLLEMSMANGKIFPLEQHGAAVARQHGLPDADAAKWVHGGHERCRCK